MEDKGAKVDEHARARVREEIEVLAAADVLVLNEVDWGMNRTGSENVAKERSAAGATGTDRAAGRNQ
jgi:hypothetical protein